MKALFLALLAAATAHADDASDASRQLAEFARPLARTLTRDTQVYHWTAGKNLVGAEDPLSLGPTDPRVRYYAGRIKESFWHPGAVSASNLAGEGLYAALDPISSHSYGDTLLRIVMPARTRFLPIDIQPLPADLQATMMRLGCPVTGLQSLFAAAGASPGCHRLRDQLVHDLDVQAVRYRYTSYLYTICNSSRGGWAFVLFDDRSLNYDRILAFPHKYQQPAPADSHSGDRALIEAMAGRAHQSLWPELKGAVSDDALDEWVQSNLYGCGEYPEQSI